jgi:hypothetical protein
MKITHRRKNISVYTKKNGISVFFRELETCQNQNHVSRLK